MTVYNMRQNLLTEIYTHLLDDLCYMWLYLAVVDNVVIIELDCF